MKFKIVFLFSFFLSASSYAQKEASIWYFGDKAGVDFSYSRPVAITTSQMSTSEGCTSICDYRGFFLFYTNGVSVWNRSNKVMPNGKGLKGHDSSSESVIAIPNPKNINLFYLFTSDAGGYANPPNNGVSYSIIDMTKDGGMGDITKKNIPLIPVASEKLTAVKHKNGVDYWVLAHGWNTNNFYAYLVTKDGVAKHPVITSIGSVHSGGKSTDGNSIGYMKFSPDGKKVAVMLYESKYAELFDFDSETGKISNTKTILIPFDKMAYGCEFSPNSKLLYISIYLTNEIYQFDVTLNTTGDIMNSATLIAASLEKKMGALQLAIDGKIYVAKRSDYLGCIANPDIKGTGCNYIEDAIYLNGGRPKLGLPNFITSYFNKH